MRRVSGFCPAFGQSKTKKGGSKTLPSLVKPLSFRANKITKHFTYICRSSVRGGKSLPLRIFRLIMHRATTLKPGFLGISSANRQLNGARAPSAVRLSRSPRQLVSKRGGMHIKAIATRPPTSSSSSAPTPSVSIDNSDPTEVVITLRGENRPGEFFI